MLVSQGFTSKDLRAVLTKTGVLCYDLVTTFERRTEAGRGTVLFLTQLFTKCIFCRARAPCSSGGVQIFLHSPELYKIFIIV